MSGAVRTEGRDAGRFFLPVKALYDSSPTHTVDFFFRRPMWSANPGGLSADHLEYASRQRVRA